MTTTSNGTGVGSVTGTAVVTGDRVLRTADHVIVILDLRAETDPGVPVFVAGPYEWDYTAEYRDTEHNEVRDVLAGIHRAGTGIDPHTVGVPWELFLRLRHPATAPAAMRDLFPRHTSRALPAGVAA